MKKYEELGFTDQFMFNKLMQDPNLCRRVLETLLQTKLSELTTPATEKEISSSTPARAALARAAATALGSISEAKIR